VTPAELLAESARLTREHSLKWAGKVQLNDADSNPHDPQSGESDYVEHAHLVSAPPDVDDELNQKLADLLDRYRQSTGEQSASRASDDLALKRYWMTGEGAGRWATWTELYDHLKKHMTDGKARQIAAAWFHERYGRWPGSDANRVAHGKPPRGERVGPG
jgi:hypothetical protein